MASNLTADSPGSPCPTGFGPTMNTDISGIGVRISFYLQALFLGAQSPSIPFPIVSVDAMRRREACLSARSGSLDEITGALYTLVATNMAMAVTSLILGFKRTREMTFHECVMPTCTSPANPR